MNSPWVDDSNAAILTDLYELTMLQAYFDAGMNERAIFDLFVRRLPNARNYLVACGLEHVLRYIETFSFTDESIDYLRSLRKFTEPFLNSLHEFRFSGDVYAVPEGTVVFANEPVVTIAAALPQAQIVETFVMNQIQLATMAASKAARVVRAAGGRPVVDFGLRRMHGADAGMKQARAFYIAGVASTSNVLAGLAFGIPVAGTMAHSFIQAFQDELAAFRHFVKQYPEAILLVDTYDTLEGVRHVIQLSRELGADFRVTGVRLDSGDLLNLSFQARQLLDQADLQHVTIVASSSLDEYSIDDLLSGGAPLDGFGVGSRMGTSEDAPNLDMAYKLAEYAGQPSMKLSEHKSSLPGHKQIFREKLGSRNVQDIIGLTSEKHTGEPLMTKVMENGRRTGLPESLDACRRRFQSELMSLPEELLGLPAASSPYVVALSPALKQVRSELADRLKRFLP